MGKEVKRICVVDTVYTLLLYYLIFGINSDDIFILSGGVPEEIRKNIKHIYFPHFRHDDIPDSNIVFKLLKRSYIILKRIYGITILRIKLYFKTRNYKVEVYGQGHLNFSFPLYEYEDSYIIEDGLGNYKKLEKPQDPKTKIKHFFGIYIKETSEGFGTHENIKKIYLTKKNVPEVIKDKTEIIDMEELWQNLSEKEKDDILAIFNINIDDINFNDETVLILTQPLVTEKFATLEEELEIYENIMEKFKDKTIMIKPHPRDSKNYEKIFPNIKIIEKYFPIELLALIGIEPDIVCSVVSTALLNFKSSRIYVYDGELKNEQIINARNTLLELLKTNNMDVI